MNKCYVIKLFDSDLIRFKAQLNQYGQTEYVDVEITQQCAHLLPPAFTTIGIEKWLNSRVIPKNREFVHKILEAIGNPPTALGIIDVSLGLSVTDSYWIVPEDFQGKFADYNLFDNDFTKALELAAFIGYDTKVKGLTTSPELTTNGMLRKCWRRIDDKLYLYKGGTFGYANTGLEPYSEYYACQIAQAMGLSAVQYDLKKFHKQLVSTCEAFTDINTSYVPIGYLVSSANIDEITSVYSKDNFADLIVFDAVICNTDRHLGNYGLLRDNKTGEYLQPCPIFDNGLSLFNYAMPDDFADISTYAISRTNAFNADQVIMARAVITQQQKAQLRKLIGFQFQHHPSYNLPTWRLKAIEGFIQKRITELLA